MDAPSRLLLPVLAALLVLPGCGFLVGGAVGAGATAAALCADYDLDDDAYVDEDEFAAGLYDTWDADDDDLLSEDEFTVGVGAYDDAFGTWDGYFDTWDADDDDFIDEDEFGVGFEETGYYDTWDTDDDDLLSDDECGDVI